MIFWDLFFTTAFMKICGELDLFLYIFLMYLYFFMKKESIIH